MSPPLPFQQYTPLFPLFIWNKQKFRTLGNSLMLRQYCSNEVWNLGYIYVTDSMLEVNGTCAMCLIVCFLYESNESAIKALSILYNVYVIDRQNGEFFRLVKSHQITFRLLFERLSFLFKFEFGKCPIEVDTKCRIKKIQFLLVLLKLGRLIKNFNSICIIFLVSSDARYYI